MASAFRGLGGRVKARADDAVSVDPVVAVDVFQGPCLAEPGYAERNGRYPVNGGQEGERVGVPVEDGYQRSGPGGRKHLVQDP